MKPILVELDEQSWEKQMNKVEKWLDQVMMAQASFLELAENTVEKIKEPHIHAAIAEMIETAKEHEQKITSLYETIGRKPSKVRSVAGKVLGNVNDALANLQFALGGAAGYWKEIHQLLLLNVNVLGAFAMTEQLGLALGLPDIVEIAFPIVHEKQTHHLLLQEYMLEIGAISLLYETEL